MDPQEAKFYSAVILASCIIGALIVLFVYSFIRQQRRYLATTRKNILTELTLLEKDRMRIAADLHDELSPVLSAVKFQVISIEPVDPADQEIIETTKKQIDETIQRLRGISKDLMPPALTRNGLVPALQDFFQIITRAHGLPIIFECDANVEIVEDKRINIYRIIQEITHNTVKHSNASKLLVNFKEKGNSLKIVCEDNGRGFDYKKKLSEEGGLGLRNIRGRATLVSNNFQINSVHGKGTQYTLDIPLNHNV